VKSVFYLQCFTSVFAVFTSECDGECRPRPGGAIICLRYRRALNVSVDSAAAGGRGPRGGVWSAPTGVICCSRNRLRGCCSGRSLGRCRGGSRALAGDSSPWGVIGDRGCSCAGRGCLSAGVSGRCSCRHFTSAVLGFLSAANCAAVKFIDSFCSHYRAPALYVCDRYRLPARH
jgi:hypothetical protein